MRLELERCENEGPSRDDNLPEKNFTVFQCRSQTASFADVDDVLEETDEERTILLDTILQATFAARDGKQRMKRLLEAVQCPLDQIDGRRRVVLHSTDITEMNESIDVIRILTKNVLRRR